MVAYIQEHLQLSLRCGNVETPHKDTFRPHLPGVGPKHSKLFHYSFFSLLYTPCLVLQTLIQNSEQNKPMWMRLYTEPRELYTMCADVFGKVKLGAGTVVDTISVYEGISLTLWQFSSMTDIDSFHASSFPYWLREFETCIPCNQIQVQKYSVVFTR